MLRNDYNMLFEERFGTRVWQANANEMKNGTNCNNLTSKGRRQPFLGYKKESSDFSVCRKIDNKRQQNGLDMAQKNNVLGVGEEEQGLKPLEL